MTNASSLLDKAKSELIGLEAASKSISENEKQALFGLCDLVSKELAGSEELSKFRIEIFKYRDYANEGRSQTDHVLELRQPGKQNLYALLAFRDSILRTDMDEYGKPKYVHESFDAYKIIVEWMPPYYAENELQRSAVYQQFDSVEAAAISILADILRVKNSNDSQLFMLHDYLNLMRSKKGVFAEKKQWSVVSLVGWFALFVLVIFGLLFVDF